MPGCVSVGPQREAEFEQVAAELAMLKRMMFGRSSGAHDIG